MHTELTSYLVLAGFVTDVLAHWNNREKTAYNIATTSLVQWRTVCVIRCKALHSD